MISTSTPLSSAMLLSRPVSKKCAGKTGAGNTDGHCFTPLFTPPTEANTTNLRMAYLLPLGNLCQPALLVCAGCGTIAAYSRGRSQGGARKVKALGNMNDAENAPLMERVQAWNARVEMERK